MQEEILTDLDKAVFGGKVYNYHTVENGQRLVKTRGGAEETVN